MTFVFIPEYYKLLNGNKVSYRINIDFDENPVNKLLDKIEALSEVEAKAFLKRIVQRKFEAKITKALGHKAVSVTDDFTYDADFGVLQNIFDLPEPLDKKK